MDRSGRIKCYSRTLTTIAAGTASAVIDVGGEVLRIRATCCTTGSVVTIQTLEQENGIKVSGDTLLNKIVTGTSTVRPIFFAHGADAVAVSGAGTGQVPNAVGSVVITITSGGDTKPNSINIYVR